MNDTKSSMRTIYPTDENYHRICRVSNSGKTCIDVFIRPINEKQAKDISDDKTIGIIICAKNNQFIIEYCSDERIFAREFKITS